MAALLRVKTGENILLCVPLVVHMDYFDQMNTDNKDSCSVVAWMCRAVMRVSIQSLRVA